MISDIDTKRKLTNTGVFYAVASFGVQGTPRVRLTLVVQKKTAAS